MGNLDGLAWPMGKIDGLAWPMGKLDGLAYGSRNAPPETRFSLH